VAQSVTVGTFMVATPAIHRYAVDCAWVTVSKTWIKRNLSCVFMW